MCDRIHSTTHPVQSPSQRGLGRKARSSRSTRAESLPDVERRNLEPGKVAKRFERFPDTVDQGFFGRGDDESNRAVGQGTTQPGRPGLSKMNSLEDGVEPVVEDELGAPVERGSVRASRQSTIPMPWHP